MSILIPSTEPGVFAEPEIPMTYNQELSALENTEGYVHDPEVGAWEKVYSDKKILWLYKDGDECVNVTGGWKTYPYSITGWDTGVPAEPALVKDTNSMTASLSGARCGAVATKQAVAFGRYKKLCVLVSGSAEMYAGATLAISPVVLKEEKETKARTLIAMGTTIANHQDNISILETSSMYVIIRLVANCSITIHQIWLE